MEKDAGKIGNVEVHVCMYKYKRSRMFTCVRSHKKVALNLSDSSDANDGVLEVLRKLVDGLKEILRLEVRFIGGDCLAKEFESGD